MEFDKSRVYTALNADELRAGDKVIVADTLADIREMLEDKVPTDILATILPDTAEARFMVSGHRFPIAYLVERAENCTNCDKHEDCVYVQNESKYANINRCENYKPRAEKHYRPFKDTDELIKVWDVKYRYAYGLERINNGLDMPLIWVRNKSDRKVWLINEFDNRILDYLFTNCEFLDGSPCGVEEQ